MPPEVLLDPGQLDLEHALVDREAIRRVNPQRYEMEQLDAITFLDTERHIVAGYKDVRPDEFWVRGHMPDYPLLPGVLMCEAAAQLCCYYTVAQKVIDPGVLMGLGGIEEARFHRPVRPGDRLVIVGTGLKVHRRLTRFHAIGYVGAEKTFETVVVGVPIGKWEDLRGA